MAVTTDPNSQRWLLFDAWLGSGDATIGCDPDDGFAAAGADAGTTGMTLSGEELYQLAGSIGGGRVSLAPGEVQVLCIGALLPLVAPNSVQNQRAEIELVIDAVHDIPIDAQEGVAGE